MNETLVKIHILSGVPASGKSTFSKSEVERINKHTNERAVHISSDVIRNELLKNDNISDLTESEYRALNNRVFEIMFEKAVKNPVLFADYSLVHIFYDSTNLSLKYRKHLYERFKSHFKKSRI